MSSVECKWVKSRYSGEQAKRVRELSAHGIGYIILESDKTGLTAAFRIGSHKELGYAMEELSDYESERMDEKLRKIQGIPQGA